jgi:murein DD-endopeptidase MepM/ murein hydrolase activator NlpD
MDSIIARQKIGKRRPSAGRNYRPAGAQPYAPILEDRGRETGRAGSGAKRRRRESPRSGFLGAGIRRVGASFAVAAARLRGGFRVELPLRALSGRLARLSKARLALGALVLAALAATLSLGLAAILRGPAFPMPAGALLPADDAAQDRILDFVSPELAEGKTDADKGGMDLPPAPVTLEMSTYTVRPGDSLAAIAKRFGLNIDTIISANGISSSSSVRSGAQLRIPNINGLVYKVRSGDSLAAVAKRFKLDTTKIVDANDLGSSRLIIGQSLFIPGARLPESAVRQALGPKIVWPARGPLSSYFGYRPDPFTGIRRFHAGIDVVMDPGTPVRAAMAGRVSDVGYNANYGNYIILNHADGFQTLYGHLTSASVREGASIDQAAIIGFSGNTGYSTGPHLHFGLFKRSLALNPLKYLK